MKTKKRSWKSRQLIFILPIFFILISWFWFNHSNDTHFAHQNLVDQKVALYSDTHITPNAQKTEPIFKNIAFESVEKQSLWQSQLAAVAKSVKSFLALPKTVENNEHEYGSWVWTPTLNLTQEYTDALIADSQRNGVNTIYLSLDSYLDIFVMPKGEAREQNKQLFENKVAYFIKKANAHGIAVDAEAGWRNWAEPGNEYKAFAIVNFVKNFNQTSDYKFRGFQYDIEPYLLPEFKTEPTQVLQNFVSLVDKTATFLADSSLRLSVVIPDFYDTKDEMIPEFSFNNQKSSVFEHLLTILDQREASSIIIMSYRSFADGYDGSIEISNNEMQTAENGGYQTKIIIAQETGDVPPPYITFNRTSKKYLNKQITKINHAFETSPNFGGIAFHYLNSLLALR